MTARMVDTSTGEILTAASGSGESSKASVSASGSSTGAIDMTSSSFQGTILGEAVTSAVQQVAANLNEYGSKLGAVRADYSGAVADVSGKTLILNVGKLKGVQVGDTIEISRVGRTILDPQTKEVVRTIVDKVGAAKVDRGRRDLRDRDARRNRFRAGGRPGEAHAVAGAYRFAPRGISRVTM